MTYLLDTDALIYLIRGLKPRARSAVHRRRAGELVRRCQEAEQSGHVLGLSALTVAELEYGAQRSENYASEIAAVRKVLTPFQAYGFDAVDCAAHYGRIRCELERRGAAIGSMDLLIAAHALSLGAVLVTNNTAHFSRVEGLKTENWSADAI